MSFTQLNNGLHVEYDINGLTNGLHGFHIHDKPLNMNSFMNENPCKECCSHFNGGMPIWSEKTQFGTPHGQHLGDLCFNIESVNGVSVGSFVDHKISIIPGQNNCIIGRSIVIHADPDNMGSLNNFYDTTSLTTGGAGDRVACANIYSMSE